MNNDNTFPKYFLNNKQDGCGWEQFLRNKEQMDKYPSIFLIHNGVKKEYFFHDGNNRSDEFDLLFYNKEKYSNLIIEDIFQHVNDAGFFYDTVNDLADLTQVYEDNDVLIAKESVFCLKAILKDFWPENTFYQNYDYSFISE